MATKIHPTAIVHASAQLDTDVELGPYVVIGDDVQIGAGTYVGPHCIIEFSTIGRNNQFTGAAYIGMPPQDYSYHGEHTRFTMGDNNIIRECVSLHRGSHATSLTSIGSGCMLMANSHVGHDCRLGDNIIMVNSAAAAGHVHIGDRALISGLAGIHQFTRIGRFAMVSGGGMANQDIIPYVIAQGDRAKPVGLNLVGMKRNGFSRDTIKSVKHVFKTLFFRGLLLKDAIAKLRGENLPPEAALMLDFCEGTKRGIARPRRNAGELPAPGND
ncbi:MAG: acyl-[acyl-carrier-protein]--UDP-N-acetylglucosamine O-acyltransferase [Elusimicrobia bacterium CG_4_10_14_0_2_um_filter_56_8]|nr:MAG: acyl-[acyl-carrier-protein]--UDP-N-acetylglucosamine O-acyltransferase [Elusimicrobia bacterium CG1_02_56_21]PJA11612.1 MAG: acyl-[acyl-carrier-protein]--UDP-N-acetylglucosamine O-acyltransferase [Elusimicrobia bacterium CG_4_10_14_0_2_um_filter_56_8]